MFAYKWSFEVLQGGITKIALLWFTKYIDRDIYNINFLR